MGTIAEKASKVLDTKKQIAAVIEEKTGENPGNVFANYPDAIRSIPTGSGSGWTGHADVEGLKAIVWTDEDIAYYQQYGVNWNEEDDAFHKVPEDNKALYGVINIDNVQDYKDILVYLPKIDTTRVTDMTSKFENLPSLISIPMIDTGMVTNMNRMFYRCLSLKCIPLINTRNATIMQSMFNNCLSITYIPPIDVSNANNILNIFYNCYSLSYAQLLNTQKVNSFTSIFQGCNSLYIIPELDMSNAIAATNTFSGCCSVVSCNLKNLKLSIDISATSLLEKSSLIYMIENAAPTSAITITLSAYCYDKFSNDPDVVAALSAQPLVSLASA